MVIDSKDDIINKYGNRTSIVTWYNISSIILNM